MLLRELRLGGLAKERTDVGPRHLCERQWSGPIWTGGNLHAI